MPGVAKTELTSDISRHREAQAPIKVPAHLRLARGIVIGTLLSIPIWGAIFALIYAFVL